MFVLKANQTIYFDVDNTLIIWNTNTLDDPSGVVYVKSMTGHMTAVRPNRHTIQHLIDHKKAGSTIVCWSAAGWEHSYETVRALELENYVDVVAAKPTFFYDDLKAEEFMPEIYRLDLDFETGINNVKNGLG